MLYNVFKAGPKKGQPKTLTDRVIRYLVEGLQMYELPNKSRYRQFTKAFADNYFVGSAGAVKIGKNASNSHSITDRIHKNMKLWEQLNRPPRPRPGPA